MPMIPPELHWLWSATWQAAVLAALVLLIQTMGRNVLSPSSRFVLWWLVLIRLCLPVTPESGWSLFNLAPQRATPIAPAHIVSDRATPEPLPAAGVPTEFVPAASSQAWTASIDPVPAVPSESIDDRQNRHPPYTVTGRLEMHWLTLEAIQAGEFSPASHVDEYAFAVASDGTRWAMSIRPIRVKPPDPEDLPPGAQPLPFDWTMLAASDGTEFAVARVRPPASLPESDPHTPRGPGSEPFNVRQPIAAVWYTYASHSALPKVQDQMLVPMEQLDRVRWGRTRGRVPGAFTLTESPPHLPEQVILQGYEWFGRLLDADTARTNTVLRVNVQTNIHGLAIPLETTIEHHSVRWHRGRITSHPHVLLRLHTLSVEPAADNRKKGRFRRTTPRTATFPQARIQRTPCRHRNLPRLAFVLRSRCVWWSGQRVRRPSQ